MGVNLPWFGNWYGHDLGRNQAFPSWPTCDVRRLAPKLLGWLGDLGVRCVRIWLFENGEGLVYDAHGRIVGLDETFSANFAVLCEELRRAGFRVYWTLLDANSTAQCWNTATRSILIDVENTRRFLDLAVRPVLESARDLTWAVDLCNEPEAAIAGAGGNRTGLGFRWWDLQPSLLLLAERVRDALPGVPISVGSGYNEHENVASGIYERLELGLSHLDYHTYAYDTKFRHAKSLSPNLPLVLGELGTLIPNETQHTYEVWKEAQNLLLRRLHGAMSAGYEAIFLWQQSHEFQEDAHCLIHRGEPGLVLHSLRSLEKMGRIRLKP